MYAGRKERDCDCPPPAQLFVSKGGAVRWTKPSRRLQPRKMSGRERERHREKERDRDRERERERVGDRRRDMDDRDRDRDRTRRSPIPDRTRRSPIPDRTRSRQTRSRSRSPDNRRRRSHSRSPSRSRSPDRSSRHYRRRTPSPDPHRRSIRRRNDLYNEDDDDKDRRKAVSDFVDGIAREHQHKQKGAGENDAPNGGGGEGDEADGVDADEIEMMKKLGIPIGFDSTKGKPVPGADVSGVRAVTKRLPRQYMNRRGGFNRPLPAERNR